PCPTRRSSDLDLDGETGRDGAYPRARRGVQAERAVRLGDVADAGEERGAADVPGVPPDGALAGELGDLAGLEGRDAHPSGDAPPLVAAGVAGLGGDVGGGGGGGHRGLLR